MKLQDRVAIVTGAGMGIGKGIATVFSREGAKIAIADINSKAGAATTEELRRAGGEALFVKTDVANEDEVKNMVKTTVDQYGTVHILVNNAGIGVYKPVLDTSSEEWDRCLGVNLKGAFLCSKYVIPHMKAAGGGSIINIASVHAVATVASTAPYAASKGGMVALTRNMAIDYAQDNIRVNAICPGWILTPLIEGIFAAAPDPEEMRRRTIEKQLLKRLGTPEDIGLAALYLASDDSSFVTGSALFVDGGLTAQLEVW
jgi:hypothetical protein